MTERENFIRYLTDLGPARHTFKKGSEHPCQMIIEDLIVEKLPVVDLCVEGKSAAEYIDGLKSHVQGCADCNDLKTNYEAKKTSGHFY